jgi:hypothetical protein
MAIVMYEIPLSPFLSFPPLLLLEPSSNFVSS